MDISVIIPVYKAEKYIESCLRSLFTQTKTDGVEFILVNDCTPDNSMEVVERLMREFPLAVVKIFNNEKNEGTTYTREKGLKMATGSYVFQMDSDDWCEPNMLEEMFKKAVDEDADVVGADFYKHSGDSQLYVSNHLASLGRENIKLILTWKTHWAHWIKLVRRSLFVQNDIRIKRKFRMEEDLALSVQMFYYAKKVVNIPKAYYHYIENPISVTKIPREVMAKECMDAVSEIEDFLKERGVFEELKESLAVKKLRIKYTLFRYTSGDEQRENLKIYPEVNSLIFKSKDMILPKKILLYLATHRLLWLANAIRKFL